MTVCPLQFTAFHVVTPLHRLRKHSISKDVPETLFAFHPLESALPVVDLSTLKKEDGSNKHLSLFLLYVGLRGKCGPVMAADGGGVFWYRKLGLSDSFAKCHPDDESQIVEDVYREIAELGEDLLWPESIKDLVTGLEMVGISANICQALETAQMILDEGKLGIKLCRLGIIAVVHLIFAGSHSIDEQEVHDGEKKEPIQHPETHQTPYPVILAERRRPPILWVDSSVSLPLNSDELASSDLLEEGLEEGQAIYFYHGSFRVGSLASIQLEGAKEGLVSVNRLTRKSSAYWTTKSTFAVWWAAHELTVDLARRAGQLPVQKERLSFLRDRIPIDLTSAPCLVVQAEWIVEEVAKVGKWRIFTNDETEEANYTHFSNGGKEPVCDFVAGRLNRTMTAPLATAIHRKLVGEQLTVACRTELGQVEMERRVKRIWALNSGGHKKQYHASLKDLGRRVATQEDAAGYGDGWISVMKTRKA